MSVVTLLISQEEPYRRSLEAEVLTYLILEISLIGEMGQFLIVHKESKGRRISSHLRSVIDLKMLALVLRRRNHGYSFIQHIVKYTCGQTAARLFIYFRYLREKLIYSLPRLR